MTSRYLVRHFFSPVGRVVARSLRTFSSASHFDLVVIGGGSGGLACAKEAAIMGKKVAILDFVRPTVRGTTWGLGGTCVNVGCIPKKLMHLIARFGEDIATAKLSGWPVELSSEQVDWSVMSSRVQDYVRSLNWGHRVQLIEKEVTYLNRLARFVHPHKVMAVDKDNKEHFLTADHFVIAVGCRPSPLTIPGAREFCISSDDLFWLKKSPGKTLVIGGSYVALECSGFLHGMGFQTELMIRSIPLRGFDQEMAKLVTNDLELTRKMKIHWKCIPSFISKCGSRLLVGWKNTETGLVTEEEFDTVLSAIGRDPVTASLNLEAANVLWDRSGSQKIIGGYEGDAERSSQSHIYALGDVLQGGVELTPVAIKAGKLLAGRLFAGKLEKMDYTNIPTTVFTPLEYSCVGLSEEEALDRHGGSVDVYHAFYKPLEHVLAGYDQIHCYIKAIVHRQENTVLGLHLTGINAGEILQGFSLLLSAEIKWRQLQKLVGIHPTSAEEIVKLHITKASGMDPMVTGC